MKAFVEGFGCSLNRADTEQIKGFLERNGFELVSKPENAKLLIINTCAVKEQTQSKMLRRIRELSGLAEKTSAMLVVFGCLPKIDPGSVKRISPKIAMAGPSLEELAGLLGLPGHSFSPSLEEKRSSKWVSIIPVARGCLGQCAYCCVKNARGALKSYPIEGINRKFRKAIKETPEVWLTAQDCGCYGLDLGTSLAELLEALLENKGDFRIRVGMANPQHLSGFLGQYLALFKDPRLFRFFHLPVQSGSSKVLKKMNRHYTREGFLRMTKAIRGLYPEVTISTDVIVGFPGETKEDFEKTVSLLKKAKPDIVNISRFGARPLTLAEKMPGQLHGRIKKERSRALTKLCREISLERNSEMLGRTELVLFDEPGKKGTFVGRTQNYKPVAVKNAKLGRFQKVKIKRAFPTFLEGEAVS
jgi:MiaB-like tRNA modifying enzyme